MSLPVFIPSTSKANSPIETLPTITRWELIGEEWTKVRFPLNKGSYRDIPRDAVLHASLIDRLRSVPSYRPCNNHGGALEPCLKHEGVMPDFKAVSELGPLDDLRHTVYKFPKVSSSNDV